MIFLVTAVLGLLAYLIIGLLILRRTTFVPSIIDALARRSGGAPWWSSWRSCSSVCSRRSHS